MSHSAEVLDPEPVLRAGERSHRSARHGSAGARRLISGASLVLGGTMIGQASSFIFNAVGAHALGPARYGVLAASVALLSLAAPLLAALQAVASREATSLMSRRQAWKVAPMLRHYGLRVAAVALVLGGAAAVSSGWISGLFHLGSPWFVVLVGAMIPCYMVSHLLAGLLQGVERFGRFALESVVEGSTRAIVGIMAMGLLWHSALAGMATVTVSCVAGLVTYLVLTLPVLEWNAPRPITGADSGTALAKGRGAHRRYPRGGAPGVLRYSITALATYSLLALMLSSDTLIAKHYLSSRQAGLYAGISLAGKISYFAASSLFVVAFPIFSRLHDQGVGGGKWLLATSGAVCATAGGVTAVFVVEPSWVVIPLLGDRYRSAEGYVSWMGAVFGLYALGCLIAIYLLAHKRRGVIGVLAVAVVMQFAGLFAFHASIAQIIRVLAVAFGVMLAGGMLLGLFSGRRGSGMLALRRVPSQSSRAGYFVTVPEPSAGTNRLWSDRGVTWREEIVAEVARQVGPAPVLLAGSRALGTAHPGSDYDVSVVLPTLRIPRAAPRLSRAAERLSTHLGARVSVNPVPDFRMRRPGGSLFVRKLQVEAIVLAAPPGWSLRRQPLTDVTEFAASSALLSAVQSLLCAFDPSAMRGGPDPSRAGDALRKAALHVAQVKLLRSGGYASDLGRALGRLHSIPPDASAGVPGSDLSAALTAGLSAADTVEGFVCLRRCILDQLAEISDAPLSLPVFKSLVRNAQYAALAKLRGRNRWRVALRRSPVEAALAATQVALLRALDPDSQHGLDSVLFRLAVEACPLPLDPVVWRSWEDLRDLVLAEWPDAHPLVGVLT